METLIKNKIAANNKKFAKVNLLILIASIICIIIFAVWFMLFDTTILINVVCGIAFCAALIWYVYLRRAIKSLMKDFVDSNLEFVKRHVPKISEMKDKIDQGIVDEDLLEYMIEVYAKFGPLEQTYFEKIISIAHQPEKSKLMELRTKLMIIHESMVVKKNA